MTRLPSAAFLPSGAFDSDDMSFSLHGSSLLHQKRLHGSSNGSLNGYAYGHYPSIDAAASAAPPPSSLPRTTGSHPLVDSISPSLHSLPSLTNSDSYPLSLASLRAAQFQGSRIPSQLQFEFPQEHRSSSRSPTRIGRSEQRFSPSSSATATASRPLSHIPPGLATGSFSRSVSVDAAAPSQASAQLVQRLTQQNTLIREAWEAERNYLEANRRRAEEVYQEERVIMEEVREGWETEKAEMLQLIHSLRERIQRLEGENAALKAVTAQNIQAAGMASPLASQRGGSADASSENTPSGPSNPAAPGASGSTFSPSNMASLPLGLDGAARRPHHFAGGSAHTSPNALPSSSSFHPIGPRVRPQNPAPKDFLSASSEDTEAPVPIIDVQEIDPKLEGIPIKANAVQKSTFGLAGSPPQDESQRASPSTSPPTANAGQSHLGSSQRGSSRVQTMQILATEESRRRTMHAGHTPNHSMSILPTASVTEVNTIDGMSEGTTPTAVAHVPVEEQSHDLEDQDKAVGQAHQPENEEAALDQYAEDPEPMLDAADDVPLKGPLMIRNMPAKDEMFFAELDKRLEVISHGENALPTVIQSPLEPAASGAAEGASAVHVAPVGGDGSHDPSERTADAAAKHSGEKDMEIDVPLKMKSTTNFGRPFGSS